MKRPERIRADALLVARGLATSRAQAQARIMAGDVRIGEHNQGMFFGSTPRSWLSTARASSPVAAISSIMR